MALSATKRVRSPDLVSTPRTLERANLFTVEEVRSEKFRPETREKIENAERLFRELGARLSAARAAIVWYRLWEYTPWIPPEGAVREATGELVLLSNSMYRPDRETEILREERNSTTANRIRAYLFLDGHSRPFWPHFQQVFRARRAAAPTSSQSGGSSRIG